MFGFGDGVGNAVAGLSKLADTLIDNLFETEEEKANAKVKLMQAEQSGRLDDMKISMSAIMAEANSKDPWTSRARPAFLYLMYLVILLCVFGGVVGIWWPTQVGIAATNMRDLLDALPEELWWLFGTGYLGYTGARTFDKAKANRGAK